MGAFGAVYEKPGYPWVFKIFTGDPAYKRYIDYVIKHQNNPYVPRIKGKIIKINFNTYALRMEKLEPLSKNKSKSVSKLYYILYGIRRASELERKELEWLEKNYPGVVDILTTLSRVGGDKLDIDSKNMMMRGKIPVLVDPVINDKTL